MSEDGIITNSPPTWEKTLLGDICKSGGGDIQTGPFGSQLHASDYVPMGIPTVMPVNIGNNRILTEGICRIKESDAERLVKYRLRAGDIVYSRRGDVERRSLVREYEEGWLCGTGCLRVRFGKGKVDPRFASYYLGHPSVRQWIVQHAIGATMPNLNTSILSALPFLCPPLHEQESIADILGSLDDKIELNRKTNETLEAMARAIFKSWFIDFDPVHAKSKGRKPEGMDAETAKLFPSSFQDSEMGRIPKGWTGKQVSEVADINTWTLGKNDDLDPVEYVEISEVDRGDIHNIQIFERGQEPSRARRRLRHGDTVMSTVRPDRRSYFLSLRPSPNLVASTGFAVLTPTKVPWSFLHSFLTQGEVFDYLGQHADGGAYPAVRPEIIGQLKMSIPNDEAVLKVYQCISGDLFARAEANRQQTVSLSSLRDSLIPRLLSGEIVIPLSKGAE